MQKQNKQNGTFWLAQATEQTEWNVLVGASNKI
jgi:hypothetical protein